MGNEDNRTSPFCAANEEPPPKPTLDDVRQWAASGAYQERREYPLKPIRPVPPAAESATPALFRVYADQLERFNRDWPGIQEQAMAWDRHSGTRIGKFESDLFAALGIEKHPKRNVLYSIAHDLGHSSGYSEVLTYAEDLVRLLET